MAPMPIDPLAARVLVAIFRLRQSDQKASLAKLAQATDLAGDRLDRALEALQRAGLLSRQRLALTMAGLAVAVAFSGSVRVGPAALRALRVA
jgi:DNA-binding IclR family transcriptional regulator